MIHSLLPSWLALRRGQMPNDARVALTRVPFFCDPGEKSDFLDQVDGRLCDRCVRERELEGLSEGCSWVFGIEEWMTEDLGNLSKGRLATGAVVWCNDSQSISLAVPSPTSLASTLLAIPAHSARQISHLRCRSYPRLSFLRPCPCTR